MGFGRRCLSRCPDGVLRGGGMISTTPLSVWRRARFPLRTAALVPPGPATRGGGAGVTLK
jgi:hypothetical protein